MNPPSVGNQKPFESIPFLATLAAILALPLIASAQTKRPGPVETIMLVREWEAQSGRLVGWLPMHQVTIELEALDKSSDPKFTKDDVLRLNWPLHLNPTGGKGEVEVTPSTRTFEGRSWIPAKRDPNLVFIARRYYVVRRIVFGEAVPRLNTATSTAANLPGSDKIN